MHLPDNPLGWLSASQLRKVMVAAAKASVRLSKGKLIARMAGNEKPSAAQFFTFLSEPELRHLCRRLGVEAGRRSKAGLVDAVLDHHRLALGMEPYGNYPPQVDEYAELLDWATRYCAEATDGGCHVSLDPSSSDGEVEGTVQLLCACYPFLEWDELLSWQEYGKEPTRGEWYVMRDFEEPAPWRYAKVYIASPWDFPFSRLYMAADGQDVTFELARVGCDRMSRPKQKELGKAIADGVLDDYGDEDSLITLGRRRDCIVVHLQNPAAMADSSDLKKDKHGIVWDD